MIELNKIHCGDSLTILKTFPDECVDCCITSPPYWGLRDYGVDGQLGLEKTPEEYINNIVNIFNEVKRVLKKEGTLWLNLGDSYISSPTGSRGNCTGAAYGFGENHKHSNEGMKRPSKIIEGLQEKNLVGIPWRTALALQAQGWYLRSDIIWHKLNPMPESVTDRPTRAHEYIFLMSKNAKYYYDADAIAEPLQGKDERRLADTYDNAGSILHEQSNAGIKKTKRYNGKFMDNPDHETFGSPRARTQRKQDSVGKSTYTGFNDRYTQPPKRNKRDVWTVPTCPYPEAHFAVFPEKLIEPCVLAGCPDGGVILDCFGGSGTTAKVALRARRNFVLIELNKDYCAMEERRIKSNLDQIELF